MIQTADQRHLLTIVNGRRGQPVGGCRCGWSGTPRFTTDEIVADYDRHLPPVDLPPSPTTPGLH